MTSHCRAWWSACTRSPVAQDVPLCPSQPPRDPMGLRDCEVFIERYCWDADVLMGAEIWSRLRAQAKRTWASRDALFGVVHELAPPR